jgi:hypothetical protein
MNPLERMHFLEGISLRTLTVTVIAAVVLILGAGMALEVREGNSRVARLEAELRAVRQLAARHSVAVAPRPVSDPTIESRLAILEDRTIELRHELHDTQADQQQLTSSVEDGQPSSEQDTKNREAALRASARDFLGMNGGSPTMTAPSGCIGRPAVWSSTGQLAC